MFENLQKSSRKNHLKDTIIKVNNTTIGGEYLTIIAGPCSVESEEQIVDIAKSVKKSGATILRGGAYKPRTSPYDFQGLNEDGLKLLSIAKKKTNLPIISEIVSVDHLEFFDDIDILQVGARNMQNFELLRELGKAKKTILLKRGFANTVEEFLSSVEYLMSSGNDDIILCERGIRTFEHATRNTLDLSAVAMLKEISHLPVIVDPSHATGIASLVKPMSLAGVASGADGIMVEVHNDPHNALSDGKQSITPYEFDDIVRTSLKIRACL